VVHFARIDKRFAYSLVRPARWWVGVWTAIAGYRPFIDKLSGRATQDDFPPEVSIAVWLLGALFILLTTALLLASKQMQNSPVAFQRNADDMERWRERGITLTWQWQLPAQHPNAHAEADQWRIDMVDRIRRKYGDRAAGTFNNLDILAYQGIGAGRATPYIDHILRTANLNTVIEQVLHGEFRPRTTDPF
jgi:hypothetical protein